ncbi:hypothetical protein DL240_12350 [Lujinxingia litoralis]|uniref:DUF192 domain-containing protein n=1 Tax=Lujinxingia litoralis TaxID=2211119 RepID=A0A328C5Q9_9DELT|nr:DUF192 domain-containing protein [Lujinxingia litoralis]RAL21641.1 hypothetical protein DL240_12350 [Lujinxingia litoralis]
MVYALRPRPALLVLMLLAMASLAFSCEHASETDDQPPAAGAPQNSGAAERCVVDGECEGFYRCLDGGCQVPPAMNGARDEDTPVLSFFDSRDEAESGEAPRAQFYTELALTAAEQSRGLMYRPHMLDDWGMLFIYPTERTLSFWMKNTLIPLDMIFINDSGRVVGVVENAEPQTLTPRQVDAAARYVFEINGGLSAELGIGEGTWVRFEQMESYHTPRR